MASPRLEFLSLFVPDLAVARENYSQVFGVEPEDASGNIPVRHPFSPEPPVVFDLGGVKIALYQVDGRTTHPGDVGIGIVTDQAPAILERVEQARGQALLEGKTLDGNAALSVFVLPDRHFFELVSPKP